MKRIVLLIALILTLTNLSLASDRSSPYFPLEQIKPGMKAIGRTIFQGSEVEEFNVEILGVLPGLTGSPKRSVIIVRLSGPLAERTGVFAGMSGSPVYIDGKLVGAIAYSFPFSKEPIGAITPIQDTLSMFESKDSNEKREPVGRSFKDLVMASQARELNFNMLPTSGLPTTLNQPISITAQSAASIPALGNFVGQNLMPIASPLAFSGIDPGSMQYFSNYFQAMGLYPIAASGVTSKGELQPSNADTLTPGKTIAVELVRGDLGLAAFGTVTWRDGDKIYAFGHPFFAPGGIGISEMPMTEGRVITVVPSINNSFKLAIGEKMVGTIIQDRATGIYGKLGAVAKMIPLKISMTTSRGIKQDYQMEMISDDTLTPLLMQIVTLGSITATERTAGELTLDMDCKFNVKGQTPITFSNSFSSLGALGAAISTVTYASYPVSVLYGSGFDFDLQSIEVNIKAMDKRATGSLSRLTLDKTELKRGEKFNLEIVARNDKGEFYSEIVPLTVPLDAPLGRLNLTVGDGSVMSNLERRILVDANPSNLAAVIRSVNNLPKNDRLYVKLYYSDTGAIVNNQAMPSLPPSMLATLESNRSTVSYQALAIATVLDKEVPPAKFLIAGQQTITIKIVE